VTKWTFVHLTGVATDSFQQKCPPCIINKCSNVPLCLLQSEVAHNKVMNSKNSSNLTLYSSSDSSHLLYCWHYGAYKRWIMLQMQIEALVILHSLGVLRTSKPSPPLQSTANCLYYIWPFLPQLAHFFLPLQSAAASVTACALFCLCRALQLSSQLHQSWRSFLPLQSTAAFITACADLMDNVLLQRLDLFFGKHIAALVICW